MKQPVYTLSHSACAMIIKLRNDPELRNVQNKQENFTLLGDSQGESLRRQPMLHHNLARSVALYLQRRRLL